MNSSVSRVMELTIRLLGGVVKRLEVSGDATVGELKQRISQLFGEPPYKQKLSADNGTHISLEDDSRTLSSYGLHSGSVVSLLITNPAGPFQVFVRNEKGQTGTYDVDVNETVDQLQTKIYNKERVPKDQQRLIYNGNPLETGRKLQEYDITPLSTIQMTLRLRGG
ncbi:ubiquitin-like protein ISG15 isoform X3 [Sinocyclocheilus rhinocerous]|uniref:Polyubiquitin-like n=1 Tax=Sinocyclocheilus rhinocerous TaxID=307959 RepID=A0A673GWI0_9TELE|nr:PREDICTED: polyubiquitin-like isoform X2 [Sinocyclocheilus rhinocerous]XP_016409388.1 PREDICTED: polyubiquitin-like isoform X3 [Sinocyclocheilus rhinocerous]